MSSDFLFRGHILIPWTYLLIGSNLQKIRDASLSILGLLEIVLSRHSLLIVSLGS